MFNSTKHERELLNDFSLSFIAKINEYHKSQNIFILGEVLKELGCYNTHYLNTAKGILLTLILLDYVNIKGTVGNKMYIYSAKKEVLIPKYYKINNSYKDL